MILCVSDLWVPFPGGAERLLFNTMRHLQRRGEQVHVVTGYEHARQFDGPPFTQLPEDRTVDDVTDGGMVLDLVDQLDPDVIVIHHHYAFQFGDWLVNSTGVPVVQFVYNTRRLDGIAFAVYCSDFARRAVGGGLPVDMVLTPPALDDVIADRHGTKIGFIKPIVHKGVELFYAIAEACRHRQFVVLRGEWQDLEMIRDDLPNVTYMDPVADIRDFYAECRLILMPSMTEDAGTVAQEAARNRLPCVSSNVDGLRETNGGGIRLPADQLLPWLYAIETLDHSAQYEKVVDRQLAYLDGLGHDRLLDDFADRVHALVNGRSRFCR